MTAIFQNSLIYALWRRLRDAWGWSLLGRMIAFFRESYAASATKPRLERLLGRDTRTLDRSAYAAFLTRLNSLFARVGRQLWPVVKESLIVRFFRSVAFHESLTYRFLFGKGMHRFVTVVFALYLPIDWALRQFSPVAALSSAWDEGFLIFGFLLVVCQRMFPGETRPNRATPLDTVMLAFLGVSLLCMFVVSPMFGIAVAGLRAVVQYMLWFYVLSRVLEDKGDVEAFCGVLTAAAVLISLHCIYQFIVAVPIPENWVTHTEQGVRTRVFSIFGSPNICGSYLVMMAPIAASYAYRTEKRWKQLAAWCAVGLMGVSCLVTFSRGAWLGFAVMVAVFAWLKDKKLLALILLGAGVAVFIPQVANRITFLFTDEFKFASENGGRAGRWREGLKLFETGSQVFGFGLGRFGGAVAMQNQVSRAIWYFYMDNYYLKTLVEMGYLGLSAYVVLLLCTLGCGLRAIWRSRKTDLHPVAVALFSGMVGVLVHSFTENIFEVPYMNALFWGMAAVLIFIGFGKGKAAGYACPGTPVDAEESVQTV